MKKKLSIRLYELLKSEFPNSSQNLAEFAKKRDYMKNHNRVLKGCNGDLYIGMNDDGWLVGAKLIRVACGDFKTWAFASKKTFSFEDVTEWFISEYKEKGMCAYTDMRHKWDEYCESGDDFRKCKHCEKVEQRMVKMVPKVWWENV